MKPADHLEITELPSGTQHRIPLSELGEGFVFTIGRAESRTGHIQIGRNTDAEGFISRHHCTVYSSKRRNGDGRDYWIQDGALIDGHWQASRQGIWVDGNQWPSGLPIQLRPGPGVIDIIPKFSESGYRCILEWEGKAEPGDDTDQSRPTLRQHEAALRQSRLYKEQAKHNKEQLERLAQSMAAMQEDFAKERERLDQKLMDQSTTLLAISGSLEKEKQLNARQEKHNRQIKLAIATLGAIVSVIAILALNVDQATVKDILEWSIILVGAGGAALGLNVKLDD